jgi:uncharacterized NAD-dependent epimerase/dehydratase family protein
MQTATILARGFFATSRAKTAHGLIRYGKKYRVISVIDETKVGSDAGEVVGIGNLGIPVVKDIDTSADVLIIGVAPSGGQLPKTWREDIKVAIENGMNIISGLHEFLSNDNEFAALVKKHKVSIMDVRKPPDELYMAQNIEPTIPVILVTGTDGCTGKRSTALELYNEALSRGKTAGFIATGQTGIMIGCDAGVVVDSLPADFVAGAVEHAVQEVIEQGKDLIFVEGQGALLHHAYSTSTIGILYGAWPKLIVLSHPTLRKHRKSFPTIPMPSPEAEIKALNTLLPNAKVIALSLNNEGAENYLELCEVFTDRMGIPAVDVFSDPKGAKIILDLISAELKDVG